MSKSNLTITLKNGKSISLDEYLAKTTETKKEPRKLYLGKITNIGPIEQGRFFITPCWAEKGGNDNICAFVSKNRKIEKEQIILDQAVLFSVGKDFKHEGKYIALDVQVYDKDADIEYGVERPDDYPTNISKSRQSYIDKDAEHSAKIDAKRAEEADNCNPDLEIAHIESKLLESLGVDNDSLGEEEEPCVENEMDDFMRDLCGPKCSIYSKKGGK
ncbi:MAG: hypothetical protein KBT06_04470 [Prevotellaceae bacterium]|nr:hypothetical protein [Candidatus Colivivens equi]